MVIFGGCYTVHANMKMGLNDIWAYHLISHSWHAVTARVLCPSARSDVGWSFSPTLSTALPAPDFLQKV